MQSDCVNESGVLYENTGSYTPDMAGMIDTEEEILADDISERGNKITLRQARYVQSLIHEAGLRYQSRIIANVIGLIMENKNPAMACDCLAMAAGMDELNGVKTQSEVADKHKVTRALISHYVIRFRDSLSGGVVTLDNFKFRKSQASREVFRKQATDPFLAAKNAAKKRHKENQVKSYIIISTDGRRFIFQARDKIENGVVIKTAKENAIHQAQVDGIEVKTAKLA